ncbi:MAG: RNA 2',3'-cyclic phosphodiesterase [Caldisericaceae bacterium]
MRIFIALKTTSYESNLFKLVLEFKKSIKGNIKWVSKDNLHVTEKFLGEVSEDFLKEIFQIVNEIASSFESFDFYIKGVSGFPSIDNARVLFFSIVDPTESIVKIMKDFDERFLKFDFKRETSYIPHITFGRAKGEFVDISKLSVPDFEIKVSALGLTVFESKLESSGPKYNEIGGFDFLNK